VAIQRLEVSSQREAAKAKTSMHRRRTAVLVAERQALADRHQAAGQPIKETTAARAFKAETFRPQCKLAVVAVQGNQVTPTGKAMVGTG
jgi:hypothetical protein